MFNIDASGFPAALSADIKTAGSAYCHSTAGEHERNEKEPTVQLQLSNVIWKTEQR